jgi:Cu(I)/Ag(I) efflux system membrane fusion protein
MNKKTIITLILLLFIAGFTISLVLITGCGKPAEQAGNEISYWTCDMHPSVRSDEPGKCPICNMDLIPVYEKSRGQEKHQVEEPASHADHQHQEEIDYWTCGMHPSVRSDEPGKCPICHMDLIPVYKKNHEPFEEETGAVIQVSQRARQLAGVEVAEVAYRPLHRQIRTVGLITTDERSVSRVSAWIAGRIDRLYIDFTGQKINRGEPLALLYSPELVSTQQEYILTLEALDRSREAGTSVQTQESLTASSRQRLLLWGISESEIQRLEKERTVREHVEIVTPIGGTVVEKSVVEGQYVKEGQHLYTVADLSHLWMLADLYEYEMGWIKTGQKVTMTSASFPDEPFEGKITFVDPVLQSQTRSLKVRAELDNPQGRLRPGMFVDVVIDVHLDPKRFPSLANAFDERGAVLSVPVSAVLETGRRQVVYQEIDEGKYIGRQVTVGPRAGDYYPVLSGLKAGDRVVVRGNFLIDSQSQLTGLESAAYDASLGEKKPVSSEHQH